MKFDARMGGNVLFKMLAIPSPRPFRDGVFFKDEQIVMPETIDSLRKLSAVLLSHEKPLLATSSKLCKIPNNSDNFTELYSRFIIQKT